MALMIRFRKFELVFIGLDDKFIPITICSGRKKNKHKTKFIKNERLYSFDIIKFGRSVRITWAMDMAIRSGLEDFTYFRT